MKNKPLKVQPPRKIYQPKYPDYSAPNPLLHPESRPYPFSQRFGSWVTAGGLLSIMSFGAGDLVAQNQPDSLYNTFPLENAKVPYMPVMFGTGMPERLRNEETLQAIRKAFAESGVELKERVWLEEEDVGVYLDGYSEADKIGFVFLNYSNMDGSFAKSNSSGSRRKVAENPLTLKGQMKRYEDNEQNTFENFTKDKQKYIERINRYGKKDFHQEYIDGLKSLKDNAAGRKAFKTLYLNYKTGEQKQYLDSQSELIKSTVNYLENRFEKSPEQYVLLNAAYKFKLQDSQKNSADLIHSEFEKLKKIKSDKEFSEDFLTFQSYVTYTGYHYSLRNSEEFQDLKADIIRNNPLEDWFKKSKILDDFYERQFISLKEAQAIDRKNKNGTQFIAPISTRDNLTIVPYSLELSAEFTEESQKLSEEYNLKNGMTPEIFKQQRLEYKKISEKYPYSKTRDLTQPEREKIRKKQAAERDVVKAKFEAMEKLTAEEKTAYKVKFDDLRERQREWAKKREEERKAKVLRKLESEVKTYIQWAKSQMGG